MPRYGAQQGAFFVSKRVLRIVATAALVVAAFVPGTSSAARPLKPSSRDFDRVQAAERAASMTLGLVVSRGCAPSDLVCIDAAANLEITAFAGKASLERKVAARLRAGKCKRAMLNRAAAYNKHAVDVRKAKAAWRARDYELAERRYFADFAQGGRFDALFLRYCSPTVEYAYGE
jgi:hypothetical protein